MLGQSDDYSEAERFNCISLNAAGNATIENISFEDDNFNFDGGGSAKIAARRELPQIASEYFMLGPMPALRTVRRAVVLTNVRLKVDTPDLRPAVIFDHVEDASLNGVSVQGNRQAVCASIHRFRTNPW